MIRNIKQIIISVFCPIFLISCMALQTPDEKPGKDPVQGVIPEERFVVYDTGIVFDKTTALEWYAADITKLEASGTRYWLSKLNKKDPGWRLPAQAELYDLNKSGRTYCKTLRLPRDVFWIKNYRIYNVLFNLDISPRLHNFRQSFSSRRHDNGDIRAFIIVVRHRPDIGGTKELPSN